MQKRSAKLRDNMQNMTKKTMRKTSDHQHIMVTNLKTLKCDPKLAEKNAVAYEKSTADFR